MASLSRQLARWIAGLEYGDLPAQAAGILTVLKAKGGKLTVAELTKAMDGKIETKQPMGAIWGFYRSKLIKGGYVSVAKD